MGSLRIGVLAALAIFVGIVELNLGPGKAEGQTSASFPISVVEFTLSPRSAHSTYFGYDSGSYGSISGAGWDFVTDSGTVNTTIERLRWYKSRTTASTEYIWLEMSECVFDEGRELKALRIGEEIHIRVNPEHRTDCSNYRFPLGSRDDRPSSSTRALTVELYIDTALYDSPPPTTVLLPEPTGFLVEAPTLAGDANDSYRIDAQWGYPSTDITGLGLSTALFWWYSVQWNGDEMSVGQALATARLFNVPGPLRVRARLNVLCFHSEDSCNVTVDGSEYALPRTTVAHSKWTPSQTVLIPIADEQHPTNITDEPAPPAVVDALAGVFGSFGVQEPQAKAHLWSIFICLLVAIGLATVCIGFTGGSAGSVFLGAPAFMLVFSLAGPKAFGVPGIFAGLALLVPSLGLVLFAKDKVR